MALRVLELFVIEILLCIFLCLYSEINFWFWILTCYKSTCRVHTYYTYQHWSHIIYIKAIITYTRTLSRDDTRRHVEHMHWVHIIYNYSSVELKIGGRTDDRRSNAQMDIWPKDMWPKGHLADGYKAERHSAEKTEEWKTNDRKANTRKTNGLHTQDQADILPKRR